MTREDLATLVLLALDKQQEYFKTRNPIVLQASKGLERQLRAAAEAIKKEKQQPRML